MSIPHSAKSVRPLETTEILPEGGGDDLFDQALAPGSDLSDYVIEQVLGGGGGGIVYSARERTSGERVAIKVLRAEMAVFPSMVTRFLREAEAVNRIAHPNIVAIHGMHELSPGRPYYVMELLEGGDLRTLLSVHGRFSPKEALTLLEPVCAAVQAAHDAGIIHRDIKANNVMIGDGDGPRVVKLLDFGIAKMLGGEAAGKGLTEPGARLGTAHNMAPEQIRCERLDARADIYALGVLLYQLLTGEYPFSALDPRQIALMHLQSPAPRPSELAPVSTTVDAVVLRCLEKHPDKRFASVNELIQALRGAVGELGDEPAEEAREALGVYAEVTIATDADELDEAIFDDMSSLLDAVEGVLGARAYVLPLRTSNALLGVYVPTDAASLTEERASIEDELKALASTLAERSHAHPQVTLTLAVGTDTVVGRVAAAGFEVLSGRLLEVDGWTGSSRLARIPAE